MNKIKIKLDEEFAIETMLSRELNPDEHTVEMNALRDFENSYDY